MYYNEITKTNQYSHKGECLCIQIISFICRSVNNKAATQTNDFTRFHLIEKVLDDFRNLFHRKATYQWFVILVIGFMVRYDHLGVTSVIRALSLDGNCYETMLHFFRSKAYQLSAIRQRWCEVVRDSGLLYQVDGKTVLIGDGVKQSKEAYHMPGVKKLHQDSEDSSKGEYIFGHLFGAVGAVISKSNRFFCIPLKINIQDGLQSAAGWEGSTVSTESHVVQMIENGYEAAKTFGKSIFLLDRYFLTVPALRKLNQLNAGTKGKRLELVTKAKRNCIAYEEPVAEPIKKRGRPKKKGDTVYLWKQFTEDPDSFPDAFVSIYGRNQSVRYKCMDLLWGQKLYQKLRFVLVEYDGQRSILVSTDLTPTAVQIIELYSRRFCIENCFREMKQQTGAFCYHFWTKTLEKLNHFKKKEAPDALQKVTDLKAQRKIIEKVQSIEVFVQISCIAFGILQLLAVQEATEGDLSTLFYTRTKSKSRVSEARVRWYMGWQINHLLLQHPDSFITKFIRERQMK